MATTGPLEAAFKTGRGNWQACTLPLQTMLDAAQGWADRLAGIDRPWLCWSVHSDWSLLQQRLVASVGWTPVVGFDPRFGRPATIAAAVPVDFNEQLGLPVLFPHFVLEFAFLFAKRLAFWHSDLLLRPSDMANFAEQFAALEDGEMAAVRSPGGWRGWFAGRTRRCWELLGCTTQGASRDQFERGCGWWMHFEHHPNFSGPPGFHPHWEYGCGIWHWRSQGGRVHDLSERHVAYGHFSRTRNAAYEASTANNVFRNLNRDIMQNYKLTDCAHELGLSAYL